MPHTRRHWGDIAFSVAAPRQWNALQQHMSLTFMNISALKIKLKACYFQELFLQSCWQQMLEQLYTNVTIMVIIIANIDCFEVGRFASHFQHISWLKLLKSLH